MYQSRRGSLTFGVLLILIGAWSLAVQFVPQLQAWSAYLDEWPAWIIGLGVLFLVAAVVGGTPGLASPAVMLSGIGGILYYQNATGDWDSWAYMWTLIPGLAGLGVALTHALSGKLKPALREGGRAVIWSLTLFTIFGALLGGPEILGDYWPVLLIVWGVWILIRSMAGPRRGVKAQVTFESSATIDADEPEEALFPE